MNQYITKSSKHCYYGNVINILNYYGFEISEAELVLISDAINCSLIISEHNLYFGITNNSCNIGLKKIGFEIKKVTGLKEISEILSQGLPVLLSINSKFLDHSYIFDNSDRTHYIVLLSENDSRYLISDSFIQTVPQNIFQGYVESCKIKEAIEMGYAQSNVVSKRSVTHYDKHNSCIEILSQYIADNVDLKEKSVLRLIKIFAESELNKLMYSSSQEELMKLIYTIKFSGLIARIDYLIELFGLYFCEHEDFIASLSAIKNKWGLIINKLMKCSMTLKVDYFKRIIEEIVLLTEQERLLYKSVARLERIS